MHSTQLDDTIVSIAFMILSIHILPQLCKAFEILHCSANTATDGQAPNAGLFFPVHKENRNVSHITGATAHIEHSDLMSTVWPDFLIMF